MSNISSIVKNVRNIMRQDRGVSGDAQRLEQLGWMLFLKILDDKDRLKLDWNLQRTLAKINYRIHTDAIEETLIPLTVNKQQVGFIYADEADPLNVALFGQTAKQWRDAHPDAEGNLRDHATLEQLVVLTNLESLNSVLIRQGLPHRSVCSNSTKSPSPTCASSSLPAA